MRNICILLIAVLGLTACTESTDTDDMLIRIAQLEIEPHFMDEYISLLKDEAEASVRLEKGVVCIFPMVDKDQPTTVRILEIYSDQKAYEDHLQTPHFKHYKTASLKMVKSLQLIDMTAIDKASIAKIFEKVSSK
jgi:quinol monooxygenase YgiN